MAVTNHTAGFYGDFSALTALKKEAQTQSPEALRKAAQEFESLFTNMMLKSMRSASIGDALTGSSDMDFYQSMSDQQLATQLSRGKGLGLADMLVQQLTRAGMVPTTADAPAGEATPVEATPPISEAPAAATADADHHRTASTGSTASTMSVAAPSAARLQTARPQTAQPRAHRGTETSGDDYPTITVTAARLPSASATDVATRKAQFIAQLMPQAQAAAQSLGLDPALLLAHAALETGWGKSVPGKSDGSSSFNLFGIKATARDGADRVHAVTREYVGGRAQTQVAAFRSYDSAQAAVADYSQLMAKPRYAAVRRAGSNAEQFAHALQASGYATDPHYASKLKAVVASVRQVLSTSAAVRVAANGPATDAITTDATTS